MKQDTKHKEQNNMLSKKLFRKIIAMEVTFESLFINWIKKEEEEEEKEVTPHKESVIRYNNIKVFINDI